ncbi:GNAT family acetyltransferase [Egibacter rhizosphaerae]|uniref:GNAT family acetyltransferase n=1 Tax=Egibacter rhizosphaerae TaxID=1670831 RepID=A0A411YAK2_9ACTN|nr:GNAT family acetyltransferase [Egibacter rhizosphaerae]QBI18207.1 GNAT family acetyltransferase [Egibacter rhizosphaerae]
MQIRSAAEPDLEAIVGLWEQAGMLAYTPHPHDELHGLLRHDPGLALVADLEGAVVGTVLAPFDGRRGWLMRLAVASSARRAGVASALVSEAERRLSERGCARVNLLVFADNEEAQSFWESVGYRRGAPVVLMSRHLDPTDP